MNDKPTTTPGLAGYRSPHAALKPQRQLAGKEEASLALLVGVPLLVLMAGTLTCGGVLFTLRWFWTAAG